MFFHKVKPTLVVILTVLILIIALPFRNIANYAKTAFYYNRNYIISIAPVNLYATSVTANPNNPLLLEISVRNIFGQPISKLHIKTSLDKSLGHLYQDYIWTDENGTCFVTYIPPELTSELISQLQNDSELSVKISAQVYKSNKIASIDIGIKRTPIIYVHGYQEDESIFTSMNNYFTQEGFYGTFFVYDSSKSVTENSELFSKFLNEEKLSYLGNEGLQVNSFNVICHSMGGLVARYYSCSEEYFKNCDIEKIIFIATPHKGSHIASLGASLYNDRGIKDLQPDSSLFNIVFPASFNKGLNSTIQTGNILGQYDEVVSFDSSSLDEWGIKTEVYNIGNNNLTVNSLLNGSFISALNHKNILSNTKIFERVEEMLYTDLPLPSNRVGGSG